MKLTSLSICLTLLLSISGCAQQPLVIGQARAAIDPEDVAIYYLERPHCNFETVAWLQANLGYTSLESMFRNMRRDAAQLGASGLYVLQTQQLEMKAYLGTAKAIRCLPA